MNNQIERMMQKIIKMDCPTSWVSCSFLFRVEIIHVFKVINHYYFSYYVGVGRLILKFYVTHY